jgi:hypothetical protein
MDPVVGEEIAVAAFQLIILEAARQVVKVSSQPY